MGTFVLFLSIDKIVCFPHWAWCYHTRPLQCWSTFLPYAICLSWRNVKFCQMIFLIYRDIIIQHSANMVLHIYWFMNVKCPCISEVNLTWLWQIMLLMWYWVRLWFCCEICTCNFQGSWPGMPWFSLGFGIRVPLVSKDDFVHVLSSWIIYRGGVSKSWH